VPVEPIRLEALGEVLTVDSVPVPMPYKYWKVVVPVCQAVRTCARRGVQGLVPIKGVSLRILFTRSSTVRAAAWPFLPHEWIETIRLKPSRPALDSATSERMDARKRTAKVLHGLLADLATVA